MTNISSPLPLGGPCLKDALKAAGVMIPPDLFPPDQVLRMGDMEGVCDQLGLIWYGEGSVAIGVEPVIVLYRSAQDRAHAVFISDIGPLLGHVDIVGLIRFVSKINIK